MHAQNNAAPAWPLNLANVLTGMALGLMAARIVGRWIGGEPSFYLVFGCLVASFTIKTICGYYRKNPAPQL